MTFPIIDPAAYGPNLQYNTMPDGTEIGFGLFQDATAALNLVGLVNYKTQPGWRQAFQYGMFGDSTGLILSIEATSEVGLNGVYSPPPPAPPNSLSWNQLSAGGEYNGVVGVEALQVLFNSFLAISTTQGTLKCLPIWNSTVLLPKLNQLFDQSVNVAAVPPAGPPTPPITGLPPAQEVGGIATAAGIWPATNVLLTGTSVAPLPGSPVSWRFQVGINPPPSAP